ncbi:hypothetical protein ACWGLC_09035 [Dietzia sp. NPDC055877]
MARTRWVSDTRPPVPVPASLADAVTTGKPFAGADALAAGLVTRYALRAGFHAIFPGVYVAKGDPLTSWDIIRAAGIWAPSDAIIGGWAAAYLHGETSYARERVLGGIDVFTAAEPRPPRGIRKRSLRRLVPSEDICEIGGLRVTAPARTAVDAARWIRGGDLRICVIDSLCFTTGTALDAVAAAAGRMHGLHGASTVARLLDACDAGAQSPQETLLRLRIERSPLPRPTSQLEIFEPTGERITIADLAYASAKVAIFYDGRHHGDEDQWRRDLRITARLTDLGWQVVRIVKDMKPDEAMRHITNAYTRAQNRPCT